MANIEAENNLIGCILKDGSLIKETALQPMHFYDPANQRTMQLIRDLEKNNEMIDLVSVIVASKGRLDKKRLGDILGSVASTHTFKFSEKKIYESYNMREAERIKSQEINSLEDIEKIKSELAQINIAVNTDEYNHKRALIELHNHIENQEEGLSGYDTGFERLNAILDGFQEGDLIISAARPSVGKTAKMLAHAKAHCEKGGIAVIHSLEMGEMQLNMRLLSSIGRINGHKMRNPKQYFNDDDWNRYSKSIGMLEGMNIYIYDRPGQTVSYIREKVRAVRKKHPEAKVLVMIDYLQLMRADQKYQNKTIEVGEITRSLKELAKQESVPVYLLSQLSRGVESRQNKRPMMSDLRESGSIEQDADVIEFLYRDDYYNAETEAQNIIEVIIAKQRNGSVGTVELGYQRECNNFFDLVPAYED